jgi:lipid A 3-O-deacylase
MHRYLVIYFIFFQAFTVFPAVSTDSSRLSTCRQFSFLYANDVYHGTDRYLTQYIRFCLSQPFVIKENGLAIQHEYLLQQNVYTPSDIFGDTIQQNDRPYSSFLYVGMNKNIFSPVKKVLLRGQVGLGIIGRHGFGEDMQREIHYAVDSRQALGWKYQVRDAPYIQLGLGTEKSLVSLKHLDIILQGQVQAGTVFNFIGLGQTTRLQFHHPYFEYLNTAKCKSFRCYLELKNEIKLVGYNGTLQGAIGSKNNPYTLNQSQITPLVYLTQLGFCIAYNRFGITISESFLSKEFSSGLKHRWGHVVFGYLF